MCSYRGGARIHNWAVACDFQQCGILTSVDSWEPSDFIWPFLPTYMGVIPNPKMAFIFPISWILEIIFPIFMKYFPKCSGKGSYQKSQIKSLEPVQPPFKLTNSKWRLVSSLTFIEYSSDEQRLWSDCTYGQADVRLWWSHKQHCLKFHAMAQLCINV